MAVQERGIRTRQRLVDAAAMVFDEAGYAGASTSTILRSTDGQVTQGSMYFHFPTKRELALAVIEDQHQAVMQQLASHVSEERPAMQSFLEITADLAEQLVSDPLVRAGMRLTLEEPTLRPESTSTFMGWIQATAMLTRAAIEQGDLRADIDAEQFGHFSASTFTGVQMVSQALTQRADLHSRLHYSWTIVLPTITPPERTARWLAYNDSLFAAAR